MAAKNKALGAKLAQLRREGHSPKEIARLAFAKKNPRPRRVTKRRPERAKRAEGRKRTRRNPVAQKWVVTGFRARGGMLYFTGNSFSSALGEAMSFSSQPAAKKSAMQLNRSRRLPPEIVGLAWKKV